MGHATVVYGYDELVRDFLLEDPAWISGIDRISFDHAQELIALIVGPRDRVAAVAEALPGRAHCLAIVQAQESLARNDASGAVRAARAAIRADERQWRGWFELGQAQRRCGDYVSALHSYTRSAQLTKFDVRPQANQGFGLSHQGRFAESEAALLRAEALEPSCLLVHKGLLEIYTRLAPDREKAISRTKRILRINSHDGYANYWQGRFLLLEGEEDAAMTALHLATAFEGPAEASMLLARLLEKRGDRSRAVERLEDKLREDLPAVDRSRIEQLLAEMRNGTRIHLPWRPCDESP